MEAGLIAMVKFEQTEQGQALLNLHMPRYGELPALELYMDQVLLVVDEVLRPLFPKSGGPILTATMINNYVRQKLVAPPVKKRYNRTHLAYFIVVALTKNVFSIAQISALIQRQIEVTGVDLAYDLFCQELEQAIAAILHGEPLLQQGLQPASDAALLRAAVFCIVNKIYVEKFLEAQE